jgi:transcriptional regulator with XRE-family HTH domain
VSAAAQTWCKFGAMTDDRGDRLRKTRLEKGLGVRELSRLAGLGETGADVSRIENGKQGTPGFDKIKALAEALGVSPQWLWDGDGPRVRSEAIVDHDDPYPQRGAAIARMRGLVSEQAIATVRADHNLGTLTEAEWVEELLRAERLAKKGLERHDGQPHVGDGPVGRPSKIQRRPR